MIRGVIFDFDGTLYDYAQDAKAVCRMLDLMQADHPDHPCLEIYSRVISNFKHSNNPAVKHNKQAYIKHTLEMIGAQRVLEKTAKYMAAYEAAFEAEFTLYTGVIKTLQLLRAHGVKVGILSNNTLHNQLRRLMLVPELAAAVEFLTTADEVGEEKPHSAGFLNMFAKMELSPEDVVMVGDDLHNDIEPALALGCLAMLVEPGHFEEVGRFFQGYFEAREEYGFLAKYFGQNPCNVQGPGGNISVKFGDDGDLLIKSSGGALANAAFTLIHDGQAFGRSRPSMELPFHAHLPKKYVVHLHYTPARFLFCRDHEELANFPLRHVLVSYELPGEALARKIALLYTPDLACIFLQNHGIILISDDADELLENYEAVCHFFKPGAHGEADRIARGISERIWRQGQSRVVSHLSAIPGRIFVGEGWRPCFPDLAVFVQNIVVVDRVQQFRGDEECQVVVVGGRVYTVAETHTKAAHMGEIIEAYWGLYGDDVREIGRMDTLRNMDAEKWRQQADLSRP